MSVGFCIPAGYNELGSVKTEHSTFPKVFCCSHPWPFIVAAVVKHTTNHMAINSFAEKNMEGISSDHAAADPREFENCMVTPWVTHTLFMCVEDKSLLFQTDLLVPFSKGTWSEIFSITFPTRKKRCPMGQTKCVTEKFMIPNHTPKHPFQPLRVEELPFD